SETCAIGTLSRRASGLCGMQFPYAQAVQRHAGLLLFGTFSFKERKSTSFPLIKGKYFVKNPVCLQRKNIFCYKIFEYEKSYLFHIRSIVKKVNAVAMRKCGQQHLLFGLDANVSLVNFRSSF
ncbi:MAG: hypothetical protein IJD59_05465, partial [Clostridia bacterium]|nr:hypothetical protein [Clostridia bacterium]